MCWLVCSLIIIKKDLGWIFSTLIKRFTETPIREDCKQINRSWKYAAGLIPIQPNNAWAPDLNFCSNPLGCSFWNLHWGHQVRLPAGVGSFVHHIFSDAFTQSDLQSHIVDSATGSNECKCLAQGTHRRGLAEPGIDCYRFMFVIVLCVIVLCFLWFLWVYLCYCFMFVIVLFVICMVVIDLWFFIVLCLLLFYVYYCFMFVIVLCLLLFHVYSGCLQE